MPASRTAPLVTAALVLASVIAMPMISQAQEDMRAKGNRLCSGDARRLCKDVLGQGDAFVLSCLQENKARLSAGCRNFLKDVGQLD